MGGEIAAFVGLAVSAVGFVWTFIVLGRRSRNGGVATPVEEATWGADPTFEQIPGAADETHLQVSPPVDTQVATAPASPRTASWLVPAVLVFGGYVVATGGTLATTWLEKPPVDCVAYVEALADLAVDYDTVDTDALALAFGSNVMEECGPPAEFMSAIGR